MRAYFFVLQGTSRAFEESHGIMLVLRFESSLLLLENGGGILRRNIANHDWLDMLIDQTRQGIGVDFELGSLDIGR
jgi:hypothetical protein